MIQLGEGLNFFSLPDWAWYQWAGVVFALFMLVLGGVLVYAYFFAEPEFRYFFNPKEDETVEHVWYLEKLRREELRGRITRKHWVGVGFAVGALSAGGGVLWLVF